MRDKTRRSQLVPQQQTLVNSENSFCKVLEKHKGRLLKSRLEVFEEPSAYQPIDDAVIDGQGHLHAVADNDLSVFYNWFFAGRADG
jgi:hypothetical protein